MMTMALKGILLNRKVHNCLPELHKKLSLKWLGEGISNHLSCRAVFNRLGSLDDLITDRKVDTVEILDPLGRGSRQLGLGKGIGYIHNDKFLSFCSSDCSSKCDRFQNGDWELSSDMNSSCKVCPNIGITNEKMRLRCTPVSNGQQVDLGQWLKGTKKVQLGQLLGDSSGAFIAKLLQSCLHGELSHDNMTHKEQGGMVWLYLRKE